MNRLLTGEVVTISGSPDDVWPILEDAEALARVLPGCTELTATGPSGYQGVLEARLAFITVRADVRAELHDQDPPRHVRLDLSGKPRGLAGAFRARIPVAFEAAEEGTRATYDVDLEVAGRLATFGAALLRDVMRRQVATMVRLLDAEIARQARAASPSS